MRGLKNLIVVFFIIFFSNIKSQNQDTIPLHNPFSIESKILNETRVINVWIPESYKEGASKYPVIYMADGGIKEDFPHIANTLAELIRDKKIPEFILVGIENTERRRDLTGNTEIEKDKKIAKEIGGSTNFRNFINDELIKYIDSNYRTTNVRAILGESLSGLFVMETFFYKPQMFDYYIAFDPSLWWNNHYLVKNSKNYLSNINSKKILWFAGSDAKDIYKHTRELEKIIKTENPKNLIWNYSDEPKEKHHTIFRATKEKALIWTLNQ